MTGCAAAMTLDISSLCVLAAPSQQQQHHHHHHHQQHQQNNGDNILFTTSAAINQEPTSPGANPDPIPGLESSHSSKEEGSILTPAASCNLMTPASTTDVFSFEKFIKLVVSTLEVSLFTRAESVPSLDDSTKTYECAAASVPDSDTLDVEVVAFIRAYAVLPYIHRQRSEPSCLKLSPLGPSFLESPTVVPLTVVPSTVAPCTKVFSEPSTKVFSEPSTKVFSEPSTEVISEPSTEVISEPSTEVISEPSRARPPSVLPGSVVEEFDFFGTAPFDYKSIVVSLHLYINIIYDSTPLYQYYI